MAKLPTQKPVQVNLRIMEGLQRRLTQAASRNGTSFNNEARVRLEKSFEADSLRSVNDVADELAYNWSFFAERFLLLDSASELVTAVEMKDFEKAKLIANRFRKEQEAATKQRNELSKRMRPDE